MRRHDDHDSETSQIGLNDIVKVPAGPVVVGHSPRHPPHQHEKAGTRQKVETRSAIMINLHVRTLIKFK